MQGFLRLLHLLCFLFLSSCAGILDFDIFAFKMHDLNYSDINEDLICNRNNEDFDQDLFFENNLVYKVEKLDDAGLLKNSNINMKFSLDENFIEGFIGCKKYKSYYVKNNHEIQFNDPAFFDDSSCDNQEFTPEEIFFLFLLKSIEKYKIVLNERKSFLCTYFNDSPIELSF